MGRHPRCNQTHLEGVGTEAYPSETEFPQTCSRAQCCAWLPHHLNDFSLSSERCLCSTPRQSAGVLREDSEGCTQVSADRSPHNRYQAGYLLPWC